MRKKAWVITWECLGDHAEKDDKVVMFLHPTTGPSKIKEIVELLYAAFKYTPAYKLSFFVNKSNPYPAEYRRIVGGQQWTGEITCGHNPFLWARKVEDIQIDNNENIRWKETPKPRKPYIL